MPGTWPGCCIWERSSRGPALDRGLLGLAVCLPGQLGDHQQVQQVQGVVDRLGGQPGDRGEQDGIPAGRGMPFELPSPGGQAITGQLIPTTGSRRRGGGAGERHAHPTRTRHYEPGQRPGDATTASHLPQSTHLRRGR
ncbi:MAG: hypothetical protein ACRDUW_01785 [Pseudonocardiaceae bacterium]